MPRDEDESMRALRRRAEGSLPPLDEVPTLIQDLQIHQIELQLQYQELRRVHGELQQALARSEQLFLHAPMTFVELDLEGVITKQNEASEGLLGKVVGQPLTELIHLGDRALVTRSLARRHASDGFECRLRHGTRRRLARLRMTNLDDSSIVAFEDITEQRRIEERIARSERELRRALELAPDAVVIVQQHEIAFVNPAASTLFATNASALLGSPVERHGFPPEVLHAVAEGGTHTLDVVDSRGFEHHAECRGAAIEWRGGPATLLLLRDLTDRRRMEARIAQSERPASLGMLVAGVAHEINNPLTFVLANLDELMTRLSGAMPREDVQLLREARAGARSIANLVRDLRSFHQVDDDVGPVRINDVVAKTVRLVKPKIGSRARLVQELGRVPSVQGNAGRLSQVLLNLILNASDAMTGGTAEHNRIRVRTWSTRNDVRIEVSDNGRGIAPADLPHLFDPFFTTRKREGGTGLGLAISNTVIQQLGGFIEVVSEVGEGSRFTIHFPSDPAFRTAPALTDGQAIPLEALQPTRPLRMLIVDDEVFVSRAIARALGPFGATVCVGSGQEAIERLLVDDDFDAIVSDVMMQQGTGDELLAWMLEHKPELSARLILVSGMLHPDLSQASGVLTLPKPLDMHALRRAVLERAQDRFRQD